MSKPKAESQNKVTHKVKRTNHLATSLERMASAGATMPRKFAKHLDRLQHLTELIRPLLAGTLGEALADSCQVVYAQDNELTLTLPSMTAVNHARYLNASCLEAINSHEEFVATTKIQFIVSMAPKPKMAHQNKSRHPKKPLGENLKQTISQTSQIVITNPTLRDNLLILLENIRIKDDDVS